MRVLILFLSLFSLILITACKGKSNTTIITSDDGKTKVAIAVDQAVSASEETANKAEELKKLTPLSADELKALLPEELMSMKRTNFNVSSMMGFAAAEATYKSDEGEEIRLGIFDCAGEAGAGIYSLNYYSKMSIQSENDNGYTKTIDFNGGKAIEVYEKNSEAYNLSYIASDRLLVNVAGEKIGLDEIKDIAKNLILKVNK
jgi:hypothetical protein